jgi:hypothetical protein
MKLPFKKTLFDFIFNDGVLHNTRITQKPFEVLLNFLTPKGEIAGGEDREGAMALADKAETHIHFVYY